MNAILWILLCLVISAGVVQIVAWLICLSKRPKKLRRGYHLIPLYDGPDQLEAQLRYCLSRIQWGGHGGEIILLVDMGLGAESLALCHGLMDQSTMFYCKLEDLIRTIQCLDRLQHE